MKLIGLLSFFGPDKDYLADDVKDLHALGVDTIVAVDGSYSNYPGGEARSPVDCSEILIDECRLRDVSLLLYQPNVVWAGDEVQKRQVMIDLAWSVAEHGDWFVVWDCDYKLLDSPCSRDIYRSLDESMCQEDFATVSFTESSNDDGWHPMQMFIRAQPVTMAGNHHTYRLTDGRQSQILRRPVENMADALDLSEIKVRHRVHERDPERRKGQTEYYETRDRLGLEA